MFCSVGLSAIGELFFLGIPGILFYAEEEKNQRNAKHKKMLQVCAIREISVKIGKREKKKTVNSDPNTRYYCSWGRVRHIRLCTYDINIIRSNRAWSSKR